MKKKGEAPIPGWYVAKQRLYAEREAAGPNTTNLELIDFLNNLKPGTLVIRDHTGKVIYDASEEVTPNGLASGK